MVKEHILQDSDLTAPERERVEAALMQEERVLWVWRPGPDPLGWRNMVESCWLPLYGGVMLIWNVLFYIDLSGLMAYLLLVAASVMIVGTMLIVWAVPLRERMLRRRSFCILTEGRILAFRLSLWGKPMVSSWTLDNVISLKEFVDGSGCLVIRNRSHRAEDEEKPKESKESKERLVVPDVSLIKDIMQPYLPAESAIVAVKEESFSLGQWIGCTIFVSFLVPLGLVLLGISLTGLFNSVDLSQTEWGSNTEDLSSAFSMFFYGSILFFFGSFILIVLLKSGRPGAKKACQDSSERV